MWCDYTWEYKYNAQSVILEVQKKVSALFYTSPSIGKMKENPSQCYVLFILFGPLNYGFVIFAFNKNLLL